MTFLSLVFGEKLSSALLVNSLLVIGLIFPQNSLPKLESSSQELSLLEKLTSFFVLSEFFLLLWKLKLSNF
jgi:hypothetical protein